MDKLTRTSTGAWLILLCTCSTALAAANRGADVDFGAHIVEEAVDLNTAHSQQQDAQAKEMESLLHWAIGETIEFDAVTAQYLGQEQGVLVLMQQSCSTSGGAQCSSCNISEFHLLRLCE